jgi:uncharacterized protein (DUF1697 family)
MMASRYAALIRGINVGRAKRVAMADLRALVEGLGFGDVRTLLNSGNVVFTGPRLAPDKAAARIEKALAAELGVSARVIVLTAEEIADAVAENPLTAVANDPSRFLVAIPAKPADREKLTSLMTQEWGTERLAVGTRVSYLWCPDGILASQLLASVNRTLRDAVTTRNWATMQKLHALTEDAP